ncbi:site-specific DNA-methyltransferase [Nitrobacter sp.]|uniref:site-specific DNA-methyltransferase n=1 Tax=Nitrobacter sp. TaxID=29420 RepID=UPI001DE7A738|nr:site-specific DNA-methyltransferase [Nitrobacter sp.]MCB1392198.1 site-specific DNA-methyltransferase [Nitrobacter sp.]MCV0386722.1 site-specific DNA-methyltransferase [Nitrobacter sp.]
MPILNWLTRDHDIGAARRVPYRLLEEAPELSAGDPSAGNMLIQGDNLEALKALLPFYAGQVKCIYIDPPYNTRSAFEHYDDNLEHSQWLAMMWPRLELLRDLLAEDGSIWVSIDDAEGAYMKVILDEIFGRSRFIATNVWQKRYSRENREAIGDVHEYIYVYAINPESFKKQRNRIPPTEEQAKIYKNPNNDPKGRWRGIPMTAQGYRPNQMYAITTPVGVVHRPPEGRCWSTIESEFEKLKARGRIWFGKDGTGQPNIIRYLSEVEGFVPWTWWPSDEVGHTDQAKKEMHGLLGREDAFGTPKPEALIQRILHIATNPGDLVLDSFLGSGTTAAVAHKTGRRYIGIEMGEHSVTHCVPRLNKVIEGEQGGISESVGWKGGDGFRFYRLGPPVFDEEGHIRSDIRFPVLAAHIWFGETNMPWTAKRGTPLLGFNDGRAFALLYNGILGDKRVDGGNVLTRATLKLIREKIAKRDPAFAGPLTVYGEQSRITAATLDREGVTFKQTPYDVKARR